MNGNVAGIRLLVTHRLSFHLMPKRPASLKNRLFRVTTLRLGFKHELLQRVLMPRRAIEYSIICLLTHPLNLPFDQYPNGACQLMLAAERLFGQHGVEGVTIRELLDAAGQANKSAVQHYFGSKEGLLEAARDMRVPQLEKARSRWIDSLPLPGAEHVVHYLAAMFLPVLEIMNDRELQSFSQLTLRLLHTGASNESIMRLATASPVTQQIIEGLHDCLPGMAEPLFKVRLRLAVGVLLSGVSEWKLLSESSEDSPYPSEAVFWTDFLVAAAGVLCAPVASEALLLTSSLVRPNTQRAAGTVRVRAKTTRRSSKLPP